MIFVTVGTQLPFERMVGAVEAWAGRQSPRPDALARVGTRRTDYSQLRFVRTLVAEAYAHAIAAAHKMERLGFVAVAWSEEALGR